MKKNVVSFPSPRTDAPPDSLDARLRFAIANERLIEFKYDGAVRVAEPHDYGLRDGSVKILVYQRQESGQQNDDVFLRDGDEVFRTYFINSRGDEQMGSTWNYLDITALGRQEDWEDSPEGYPQTPPYKWWNWHDEYSNTPSSQWSSVVDRSLALQGEPVGRNADGSDDKG